MNNQWNVARRVRWLLLATLLVGGCGGLQEMWSPGSGKFHPKSLAVLPPIVGAYEGTRDAAAEVVVTALKESGRFETVMGRDQVSGAVQASRDTADSVVGLLTRLETVGQADKETALKLGRALQVEGLLVVKVNAWEYATADGAKIGKVALGFRLIDVRDGTIAWKGRHEKTESYWVLKPDLKDVAAELAAYMVKYMP